MRSLRAPKSSSSFPLGIGMAILLTSKFPVHPFSTAVHGGGISSNKFSRVSTLAFAQGFTPQSRSIITSTSFSRFHTAPTFTSNLIRVNSIPRGGACSHFRSSSLQMSNTEEAASKPSTTSKYLLSVQECLDIYKDPTSLAGEGGNVVFLDGSWHLGQDRDGREEYEAGPRIKGAKYFDIDDVSSKSGTLLNPRGLPHMRPPKELFAAAASALQIQNDSHIIIYGTEGCIFIHRAAYTFQNMGHDRSKIHLMQGSLQEWMDLGGDIDTEPAKAISVSELDLESENVTYEATEASQFCDFDDVMDVVKKVVDGDKDVDSLVVDARGAGRFKAEAPEPRPGMRSGHMPGSVNVPFMTLLEPSNLLKLKPASELKDAFESAGIEVDNTDKKLILSCGSGVSACILATALQECGRDPASTYVYDGSWSEWGADSDTPIVS